MFEEEHFCTWKDLAKHIGFQRRCLIDLDHALIGFNRHKFWNEILGQVVVGKFQPRNMGIQHPTLRLMHRWIAMTLFSRQDIRVVCNDEMKILYAMIKKIKIAPVKEIFKHWLELLKTFSTSISCTSLVTCIGTGVSAIEDRDIDYILTPRLIIDEHYLLQGHHLKHNVAGQLVFFFQGCTNKIPLPNLDLCLYNFPVLTFPLIPQEEAHRGSVSGRMTRSRGRNKASSSQQPQP